MQLRWSWPGRYVQQMQAELMTPHSKPQVCRMHYSCKLPSPWPPDWSPTRSASDLHITTAVRLLNKNTLDYQCQLYPLDERHQKSRRQSQRSMQGEASELPFWCYQSSCRYVTAKCQVKDTNGQSENQPSLSERAGIILLILQVAT